MLMQTAIILLVVTPFSFDLHLGGVLVGMVILSLFASESVRCRSRWRSPSKDQEWLFWTVQQTLIFPVLLLAGVLLPLDGAPGWLQVAADLNPMTYVVEAERALFAGPSRPTPSSTASSGPPSSRRSGWSSACGRWSGPARVAPNG